MKKFYSCLVLYFNLFYLILYSLPNYDDCLICKFYYPFILLLLLLLLLLLSLLFILFLINFTCGLPSLCQHTLFFRLFYIIVLFNILLNYSLILRLLRKFQKNYSIYQNFFLNEF